MPQGFLGSQQFRLQVKDTIGGTEAGPQFARVEGLGDIVVRPGIQSLDLFRRSVTVALSITERIPVGCCSVIIFCFLPTDKFQIKSETAVELLER